MFTEKLAAFVAETTCADIPDDAMEAARNGVVDTLGCALAGTAEPVAAIARGFVADSGGRGPASVWAGGLSVSAPDAAFANGIAAHALDFDDSHPHARGHASASLVPTVIAAGEAAGASGRDVLAAYVVGIEVAGKVGRIVGQSHLQGGWHPTATIGTLACTAAAARLAGLDAGATARAFGVAASEICGLVRNFGTMTKPFHAGRAARSGSVAAAMAKAGLTADETLFDGVGGVFGVYGASGEPAEAVAADLGKTWEIVHPANFVKRWPCCYSNHRAIAGLTTLIAENDLKAGEIEEVEVAFLPGGDKALVSVDPKTGLEGKFSIEYCVAALFLDGVLGLSTFTDEEVMRPEAQALIKKVKRRKIASDTFQSGILGYNDIIVKTARGTFETRVDKVPGSPAAPLTQADRAEKFTDCARIVLGEETAGQLLKVLEGLRTLPRIADLTAAMVAARARAAE